MEMCQVFFCLSSSLFLNRSLTRLLRCRVRLNAAAIAPGTQSFLFSVALFVEYAGLFLLLFRLMKYAAVSHSYQFSNGTMPVSRLRIFVGVTS